MANCQHIIWPDVEPKKIVDVASADVQLNRVGPFVNGMSAQDAASLCMPKQKIKKALTPSGVFSKTTFANFGCLVRVKGVVYVATAFVEDQQLTSFHLGSSVPETY